MIKFTKIEPGMVLLDIHSEPMGNTTMKRMGCWKVRIVSVDKDKRTAMASWNGNPPRLYTRRQLERLYAKAPPSYVKRYGDPS